MSPADGRGAVTDAEVEAAGRARVRQLIAGNRFGLWQITDPARIDMAVEQCWQQQATDLLPALRAAASARHPAQDGGAPGEVERLTRERDALLTDAEFKSASFRRLLVAFHDATRRPLGVTPASGDEFYDPDMAAMAEMRRPLIGANDRVVALAPDATQRPGGPGQRLGPSVEAPGRAEEIGAGNGGGEHGGR